jgi:hypothetical protein
MERTISPDLETALERITPTRAQWDAWTRTERSLAGLTYRDLRYELRAADQHRKDQLLGALVRVTHDDPCAFGVVAACLLPAVRRRVRQYGPSLEREDALAVLVEGLYEAVAGYNAAQLEFVATNLLALPTRRLRRAAAHQQAWHRCDRHEHHTPIADGVVEPPADALLAGAIDAGLLTAQDAQLILDTRIAGHSLRAAAQRLGLRYEAAKKRRQRAEARWASWWTGAGPQSRCEDVA